jgi:hypothetical protein
MVRATKKHTFCESVLFYFCNYLIFNNLHSKKGRKAGLEPVTSGITIRRSNQLSYNLRLKLPTLSEMERKVAVFFGKLQTNTAFFASFESATL